MAALIREQDVDYNDIKSVLNYIVQQVNNGQDLVIDFTKKRSYRGSSYYHEDIKYKRALLDIATALVKRGEDYTEMYFKNAVRAHHNRPEDNEYLNYYDDFLPEYIGDHRTAPKTTHYEFTFMIGSKKTTLHYSNKPAFYDDHEVYFSNNDPDSWPEKMNDIGNMGKEALNEISLAHIALVNQMFSDKESGVALFEGIDKKLDGRASENIGERILNFAGLPIEGHKKTRKSSEKSKKSSRKKKSPGTRKSSEKSRKSQRKTKNSQGKK